MANAKYSEAAFGQRINGESAAMHPDAHIMAIQFSANSLRRFACGVPQIGVRISTVRDFKEPGILSRVVRDYIGFHALDSEWTGIRVV